jgi:hypothetical protein
VAELRFGLLPGHVEAGKYLVWRLESIANEMEIRLIYYFHLATQHQGLQVMQDSGYSPVGRLENYYFKDGIYIDRVYLSKKLDHETGLYPHNGSAAKIPILSQLN